MARWVKINDGPSWPVIIIVVSLVIYLGAIALAILIPLAVIMWIISEARSGATFGEALAKIFGVILLACLLATCR